MENKFIILCNYEEEPFILLSEVKYHKEITAPAGMGKPLYHAGGGKWIISPNGELKLYDLSGDFGYYDKKLAKEAFDKKNIYYFDEPAHDKFKITKLKME